MKPGRPSLFMVVEAENRRKHARWRRKGGRAVGARAWPIPVKNNVCHRPTRNLNTT